MNSPKNPSSAWRYFIAGLKPFRKFAFWGPPSIIAVMLGFGWLYYTHPEWRTTAFSQPEGVTDVLGENGDNPSNPDIGLEMPLQSLSQDAQTHQQTNTFNPNSNLGLTENTNKTSPTTGNDPFNQLTGKSENKENKENKESETNSIFLPLLPNVKNPSSLVTNNNNSQQQNNNNTVKPTQQSIVDGLVKPKPVTVSGNPLQSAIDREFVNNSNSTNNETTVQTQQSSQNQSNQFNTSSQQNQTNSSNQSQQTNNNLSNQTTNDRSLVQNYQPLYNPPTQNNLGQPSSVQTSQYPYLNSPIQPNYNQTNSTQSTQQQNQSYQSPYLNNPVQPSAQNYQSPYLNNPIPQVPPVTQTQYNQPNYGNNNGVNNNTNNIGVPQYQNTIEEPRFEY